MLSKLLCCVAQNLLVLRSITQSNSHFDLERFSFARIPPGRVVVEQQIIREWIVLLCLWVFWAVYRPGKIFSWSPRSIKITLFVCNFKLQLQFEFP